MIIARYVASLIIKLTLLFFLAAASFMWLIILFSQLGDIGTGQFGFLASVYYSLLKLTEELRIVFPIACLLGTTIALSLLTSRSELTIIRLAGYSFPRLLKIIGAALLLLLIPFMLFLELVSPKITLFANEKKQALLTGEITTQPTRKIWLKDGDEFIYIDLINLNNELENVVRLSFSDNLELLEYKEAKSAQKDKNHWSLFSVTNVDFDQFPLKTEYKGQEQWDFLMPPGILRQQQNNFQIMTFPEVLELWLYSFKTNHVNSLVSLTFWQRIFYPFSVFFLVLLVIPLLMKQGREVSFGLRIVLAVVLGVLFYFGSTLFGYVGVTLALPAWLSAGFLPIVMLLAIVYTQSARKQ